MDKFKQFTDEEITVEFFKRWGFNPTISDCFDEETGEICERYYTIDPEPFDDETDELVEGTHIEFGFSEIGKYKGYLL